MPLKPLLLLCLPLAPMPNFSLLFAQFDKIFSESFIYDVIYSLDGLVCFCKPITKR